MILTISLRNSRLRKRILVVCALCLAILTGLVIGWSVTQWWGDYVWLYPLLLGGTWFIIRLSGAYPELACWEGVNGASRNGERHVILRCQEGEFQQAFYQSSYQPKVQSSDGMLSSHLHIVTGLLLPWLVILNVHNVTTQRQNHWCWIYRDQVDDTGWARLRRVARQPD